jgi:hypothetical protein
MLINLFNDEAKHWHLNTCMEYVNDWAWRSQAADSR